MTPAVTATLGELAELINADAGANASLQINGFAPLDEAANGQITFIDGDLKLAELAKSGATAAVVPTGTRAGDLPVLEAADVHAAFATIVNHFRPSRSTAHAGISPTAIVDPSATIGKNVGIHPGATISTEVTIGDNCQIFPGARLLPGCVLGDGVTIGPNVVLYENTQVGSRTALHAGSVIGANGFGYDQHEGRHVPSAQLGHVEIGDDVEIGANVAIDRGAYGATRIGDGTKIDNLVQIAHNCQIGRHNLICSQVGIAGSTSTGDYVVMGGQAGVRDHVHIGTGAVLSAMAGVPNNVPDGAVMLGIPATPEREQKLKLAALAKLPQMRKEFKAMKKQIAELEASIAKYQTNRAA